MKKTYKISEYTVKHPELGKMVKQKIEYFVNGISESVEYYDETVEIRTGYTLEK